MRRFEAAYVKCVTRAHQKMR